MFGFPKRPEDVQNEFLAVERGKSPKNRLYAAFAGFGCSVFKEVSHEWQSLANGRDEGCHLFHLFSWPLMVFPRGCLPPRQQSGWLPGF